jgi:hypothetical protein
VEPAPEIVPDALVEELVELLGELEDLVELDSPHAARPNASIAELRTAPILFLVTTSPWLDY